MMKHKLIFVNWLHRSWTSVLDRIIKSHADISGMTNTGVMEDEGQLVQSIYPPASHFWWPWVFWFHSWAYMDGTHILATKENQVKLFNEWEKYWDTSKGYLCEKSPPNLIHTQFLQEIFSDYETYFITITRHPVPVSLATQKRSLTSLDNLIEHRCICHEQYMEDRKGLKNEIMFSYENLIQNPEKILWDISSFLWLDDWLLLSQDLHNANKKYFTKRKEGSYDRVELRMNRYFLKQLFFNMKSKSSSDKIREKYEERIQKFWYSFLDKNWL